MRGSQLIQRPAEHAAKLCIDITEGGLARFKADKIRHHAAVNLTADAFHRAVADAGFICRQNVTGGGADNFHQRVGLRTRAHGPIWQSNAPPEMVTFCGRPRRFAHSSQSVPTGISAVKVSVNSGYVRFC